MAELKTKPTTASVAKFVQAIEDEQRRKDARAVMKLMRAATGASPRMWGPSIIGYGTYHFKYESGREGDWFVTGFSPRKQALTLYLMCSLDKQAPLLEKLGKHSRGKGCLYIKKLEHIDMKVLDKLINESARKLKAR